MFKKQPSKEITSFVRTIDKDGLIPSYRNDVSIKAVRNLLLNFDNVTNEEWYEAPDRSVVTFSVNDIQYRVDYDKQGNWIQTIRIYGAAKLPADVRDAVRSTYYDYNIFQVQEVEIPLHPVNYFITIDNKTKLINLRVYNGEIEELQKFDKSK